MYCDWSVEWLPFLVPGLVLRHSICVLSVLALTGNEAGCDLSTNYVLIEIFLLKCESCSYAYKWQ